MKGSCPPYSRTCAALWSPEMRYTEHFSHLAASNLSLLYNSLASSADEALVKIGTATLVRGTSNNSVGALRYQSSYPL